MPNSQLPEWKKRFEKKHWWLKDRKFKKVSMATLYRLGLLYQSEQAKKGIMSGEVPLFLIWLEKYIEE